MLQWLEIDSQMEPDMEFAYPHERREEFLRILKRDGHCSDIYAREKLRILHPRTEIAIFRKDGHQIKGIACYVKNIYERVVPAMMYVYMGFKNDGTD